MFEKALKLEKRLTMVYAWEKKVHKDAICPIKVTSQKFNQLQHRPNKCAYLFDNLVLLISTKLVIAHAQGLRHKALFLFEPFHNPCSGTSSLSLFIAHARLTALFFCFFNYLPLSGLFCKTVYFDRFVLGK